MGCSESCLRCCVNNKNRSKMVVLNEPICTETSETVTYRNRALSSRRTSLSSSLVSVADLILPAPYDENMASHNWNEGYDASCGAVSSRSTSKKSNIGEGCVSQSGSSTSSTPQLFRMVSTKRAQQGEGTWEWWYEQVESLRITQDNVCRAKLQDIPNRLTRQYNLDKNQVELDLGWCYMERSAPYVLGRLLASPFINEIRWVTSLRLDGNYFTDDGFGNMLAVMSAANEKTRVLPLLKNLYLNNMNLDPFSVHGILFYLFPLDQIYGVEENHKRTIAGKYFGLPIEAYLPFCGLPCVPLFPSLEVLSLCDNPSLGNSGLAEILRCFVAPHCKQRVLSVLDLSRCGVDEIGVRYLREYLTQLSVAVENGEHVVIADRIVLFGNRHSNSPENNCVDTGTVLSICDDRENERFT